MIHRFVQGGGLFVIDPASGAVHVTDKPAYDLIGLLDETALPLAENDGRYEPEVYGEIRELYEKGLLFAPDEFRAHAEEIRSAPLKALCLNVSHDCNLRCEYCFAENGGYGGERGVMPPETAIKAIDFLVQNSGERAELEADFFGGEPLMAWETVTAAVGYARSRQEEWGKHFRFTVTTNGILLDDDKTDFINREMSNCILSLDGREEVNDALRGKGVYAAVVPKFQKLVRGRNKPGFTDYYVRGTFTALNADFSEDVLELSRLGFTNVSLEPATGSGFRHSIKKEHIGRVCAEYDRLYDLIKGGAADVNFFHFNVDLKGGPCVFRRLRGCGCGNEYAAVAPNGDIYPCHRFVGVSGRLMGNVSGGGLDKNIRDYFIKTHIYSKSDCPDCWARFYCSGGCNAASCENYGNARVTHADSVECMLMKKRLECGIALSIDN